MTLATVPQPPRAVRSPAAATADPQGGTRRVSWRAAAVRLGGSAVALGALFWLLPRDQIAAAIVGVPMWVWGVAVPTYLLLHLMGIVKWRLLVNAAGAALPFRAAARAYYGGLFGNTFLPSIVGGDVVRAGLAFGAARSRTALVLGSLVDRIQDVIGLAAVAAIGVLLAPRALDAQSRRLFLTLAATLAVAGIGAAALLVLTPVARLPYKVRRKLVLVRRALRATAANPGAVATGFVLGMMLQALLVVLNWWLGRACGIDIPLHVWLFVWPLAKIAGLLPVTQGGIGVREAAQVALFAPFGVPAALAFATGLVFEAVIIAGGLIGGAISFALRRPKPLAA